MNKSEKILFILLLISFSVLVTMAVRGKRKNKTENVELLVSVDSTYQDTTYWYNIGLSSKLDSLIPYRGENKVAFIHHVSSVGTRLGVPSSFIFTTYYYESGLRYNVPNLNNNGDTVAYGLCQWTKISCKELGITMDELYLMGLHEQIELSYKWFVKVSNQNVRKFEDFFLANYMPSLRNKCKTYRFKQLYIDNNPTYGETVGEFKKLARIKYGKINQV